MQQQLASPGRFVILAVSVRILTDMGVEQPGFVALHFGEAIL